MKQISLLPFLLLCIASLLHAQDDRWVQFVSPPLVDGPVHAIYADVDAIYVGGNFNTIEGIQATHLARYDRGTQTWSSFGPGTSGPVYAIARIGDSLYIGGDFLFLGPDTVSYIAACRLSDTTWHRVDIGVNGFVYTMAVHGDDLYIGGEFEIANDVPAMNIVRWNSLTKSYDSLAGGLGSRNVGVHAITIDGDSLYAAGPFFSTGGPVGIVVNHVARWDIDSARWEALGSGVSMDASSIQQATALALAIDGDYLYVGGRFDSAGAQAATNVARWAISSGTWSAVAPPENGSAYAVHALAVLGNDLYVGARDFPPSEGNRGAPYLRRWNTTTQLWSTVGLGVDDSVLVMTVDGSRLLVGGRFSHAGDFAVNGIASWNPTATAWSALRSWPATSINGPINAMAYDQGANGLYVGGYFSVAGDLLVNNIAQLVYHIGVGQWKALGKGTNGVVKGVAVAGGKVYVGGAFTRAGDTAALNIAVWDTTTRQWSPMGGGVDGEVRAIAVVGTDVYVGGSFSEAGGSPARSIARWNGTEWSTLGAGDDEGVRGGVYALASIGNELFVGGNIFFAGSTPVEYIGRWNRSNNTWNRLAFGTGGPVYALATRGSDLFVGGTFQTAGSLTARNIARWNTQSAAWDSCGPGVENSVHAIAIAGAEIFIGGDFTSGGGTPLNFVASGNGGTSDVWRPLGSGVGGQSDSIVTSLAAGAYHVFVGGNFVDAGNERSIYFAGWLWNTQSAPREGLSSIVSLGDPLPNPTRDGFTFSLTLARPEQVRLSIVSTNGTETSIITNQLLGQGGNQIYVSTDGLATGAYLLVAHIGSDTRTLRVVVE